MAIQLRHFACLIPKGTAIASPVTIDNSFPAYGVQWIEWDMPDGPDGHVGFYFASKGQQIIPFALGNAPNYFVTNATFRHWDLEDQPTSGSWQVVAYNTGTYDHTLYVTYGLVQAVGLRSTALPDVIASGALSS